MSCFNFPYPPTANEVVFNTDNHQHYKFNASIGAWETIQIPLDPIYVNREGDSMSGTIEVDDVSIIVKDNELINKGYVDNRLIELEEEIDAIAPSVERGQWLYNGNATSGDPGAGYFYLLDRNDSAVPDYASATKVVVSHTDNGRPDGTPPFVHSFDETTLIGDILYLTDLPDPDELQGEVTEVVNHSGYAVITIVQQKERGRPEHDVVTRFNFFEPPSIGDLTLYLPLTGGELTGNLSTNTGNISIKGKNSSSQTGNNFYVASSDNQGLFKIQGNGHVETLKAGFTAKGNIVAGGGLHTKGGNSDGYKLRIQDQGGYTSTFVKNDDHNFYVRGQLYANSYTENGNKDRVALGEVKFTTSNGMLYWE